MSKLVLFNKPYAVLSQFTDTQGRAVLADYLKDPDLRVAGRLDFDSEGLMLLSDNGQLIQQISNPRNKMSKTYYAQVEGMPDEQAMQRLRNGIVLKDGPCLPARVRLMEAPEGIWPRPVPIRFRKNKPVSWLAITITEGRNRQVRRMLAHVGYPVLRLIRWQIGVWSVADLAPGEQRVEQIVVPPEPAHKAVRKHVRKKLARKFVKRKR